MYIWMKQGKPWRDSWDADGGMVRKQYYAGGVHVRYGYHADGSISREYWFKNNQYHRGGDKPSIVYYDENGSISGEYWYKNGVQYTPVR